MLVASDLIANNRPQICPKQCVYNMFGFNAYTTHAVRYAYGQVHGVACTYCGTLMGLRVHMALSQV